MTTRMYEADQRRQEARENATNALLEKTTRIRRIGGRRDSIHINAYGLAGELGIGVDPVIEVLKFLADAGIIRLTTWRNDTWREVDYREWRNDQFFLNPHDGNCVRVYLS